MNRNKAASILAVFAFMLFNGQANAASIKGVVKYDGEVPKFREIKMDADPICLSKHAGQVFPQTLELGENKEIANVFVHVTSKLPQKDYPTPTEPVTLDQHGCMYSPHVLGVMVGQPLKILNPDGTLHNVHALSKANPEFNLAMPKFRTETTKTFENPEFMFPIKCDVHPWMASWVSVMSHPYYFVTKIDGSYTLDNLPAGTYEIEAWQEKLGTQKASVTLTDGDTQELNFTFSRPSQ